MYKEATPTLLARFQAQVAMGTAFECWRWLGAVGRNGYGRIRVGKRGSTLAPAHRVAYWLLREHGEPYADDDPRHALEVDHTCENRWCVNPFHLQLVTPRENKHYRYHPRGTYKPPAEIDPRDVEELDDLLMDGTL